MGQLIVSEGGTGQSQPRVSARCCGAARARLVVNTVYAEKRSRMLKDALPNSKPVVHRYELTVVCSGVKGVLWLYNTIN